MVFSFFLIFASLFSHFARLRRPFRAFVNFFAANFKKHFTFQHFCAKMAKHTYLYPWHSWIARQTPTLKVAGSNPVGYAKRMGDTVRDRIPHPFGVHDKLPYRPTRLFRSAKKSEQQRFVKRSPPVRLSAAAGRKVRIPFAFRSPSDSPIISTHQSVRPEPASRCCGSEGSNPSRLSYRPPLFISAARPEQQRP